MSGCSTLRVCRSKTQLHLEALSEKEAEHAEVLSRHDELHSQLQEMHHELQTKHEECQAHKVRGRGSG